jgi:hypothetical protein
VFHFQQLGHTCHQFLPEEWFDPREICNWDPDEMEPIDALPTKRKNVKITIHTLCGWLKKSSKSEKKVGRSTKSYK